MINTESFPVESVATPMVEEVDEEAVLPVVWVVFVADISF
jgi:hypothetical protein